MKMIYETPKMECELFVNKDVMTASAFSPDETKDKDNTYVRSYSIFNGLMNP